MLLPSCKCHSLHFSNDRHATARDGVHLSRYGNSCFAREIKDAADSYLKTLPIQVEVTQVLQEIWDTTEIKDIRTSHVLRVLNIEDFPPVSLSTVLRPQSCVSRDQSRLMKHEVKMWRKVPLEVVIRQDRDDGFEHKDHYRQPRSGSGGRGSRRRGRSVAAEVYKVVKFKKNGASEGQSRRSPLSVYTVKCTNRFHTLSTSDFTQHAVHDLAGDKETPTAQRQSSRRPSNNDKKRPRYSIVQCSAYTAGLRGGGKCYSSIENIGLVMNCDDNNIDSLRMILLQLNSYGPYPKIFPSQLDHPPFVCTQFY